jgi:hypothetical protein
MAQTEAQRRKAQRAAAREAKEQEGRSASSPAASPQPPASAPPAPEEESDAAGPEDIWDEVEELLSKRGDWRSLAEKAGGNPNAPSEGQLASGGDLPVSAARERSYGPEWDRAFLHAIKKGNSVKGGLVYADSHAHEFGD